MRKKIKYSPEDLQKFLIIDTSSRSIGFGEAVNCLCGECKKEHKVVFKYLKDCLRRGKNWTCEACRLIKNSNRGKTLSGSKNPMFGKKQTDETKELISNNKKAYWLKKREE